MPPGHLIDYYSIDSIFVGRIKEAAKRIKINLLINQPPAHKDRTLLILNNVEMQLILCKPLTTSPFYGNLALLLAASLHGL